MSDPARVVVRAAQERDIEGVRGVFLAAYGHDYPHPRYFDRTWLTRAVHNDDVLVFVAVDPDERVLGTASVVFDVASHSDLIGEFGRLVVLPEARGRGIGGKLMDARLAFMRDRLQVGLVANRDVHPYSQRISRKYGFAQVGLLPMRHLFDAREHIALYVRYFGNALELRRNHPRVAPAFRRLALTALAACGLQPDVIVDERSTPYPPGAEFEIEELGDGAMSSLLRIERGRLRKREIFGPMRLHYGLHALSQRCAAYLIARDRDTGAIDGAVGYLAHEADRAVHLCELIASSDRAPQFLLHALMARLEGDGGVDYVEVDVSAHAPRMQRTLLALGFLPAAYVPAMVFHAVERLDVIKMVRLLVPPRVDDIAGEPGSIGAIVRRTFERQNVLPRIAAAVHRVRLFEGLSDEQARRVAGFCEVVHHAPGATLFAAGDAADAMEILLDGEVEVRMGEGDAARAVGRVRAGESLGEVALVLREPHSATALATAQTCAARLSADDLATLGSRRPDIAVVLYRNLAVGLGRKLRRADLRVR